MSLNACQTCGACCAYFRVNFPVYELDDMGGTVPSALTLPVNGVTQCMQGTDRVPIRCTALTGQVGQSVGCGIYERRPSPCRDLQMASEGCQRARMKHGLPPLDRPDDGFFPLTRHMGTPPSTGAANA